MSNEQKPASNKTGYCTPSLGADLIATLLGLALVYGMITLVGNTGPAQATISGVHKAEIKTPSGDTLSYRIARERAIARARSESVADLKQMARGQMAAFAIHASPKKLPVFVYVDEKKRQHSLKELRGKVVLLNLWATWCGPCRHEMPDLDALKKKYKDRDFEMLTISIDRGGLAKPRRFFNKIKVKNLTLYGDQTGRLAAKLRAFGMPTTLLIDREGREIGRMAGPAKWASRDALALIEAAMANGTKSRS